VSPPGDFKFRSGDPTLGFVFLFLILAPGLPAGYVKDRWVTLFAETDIGVVALLLFRVVHVAWGLTWE
jgi:hypothetical protein